MTRSITYFAWFPAALLVFGAVSKFRGSITTFEVLTASEYLFNILLPLVEIAFAIGLIFTTRFCVLSTIILFSTFAGFLARAILYQQATCNCFGGNTSPLVALTFDLVAIGLLVLQADRIAEQDRALHRLLITTLPISAVFWILNDDIAKHVGA
jgi:hypothetical protein